MLNYFDLRKGVQFLLDGQPYEVLDFQQIIKAQDATVIRTKVKNLLTGKIVDKTFHKGDTFEETESEKWKLNFYIPTAENMFSANSIIQQGDLSLTVKKLANQLNF